MFVVTGKSYLNILGLSLALALSMGARALALETGVDKVIPLSTPVSAEQKTAPSATVTEPSGKSQKAIGINPGLPQAPQKNGRTAETVVNEAALHRKIVIDVPSRTLSVMEGNHLIRRFAVGVGRVGFPTPVGKFKVIHKVMNPGWENPYQAPGAVKIRPSALNPLGTRWIGFKADAKGEYGMHGTDRPTSVGKLSSHGCVRMRVPDAETLYDLVEVGTPVEVTYQVAHVSEKGDNILLTVYPDWFKKGVPTPSALSQQLEKRYADKAQIDANALASALKAPTEKPVVIGKKILPVMTNASKPTEEKSHLQGQ